MDKSFHSTEPHERSFMNPSRLMGGIKEEGKEGDDQSRAMVTNGCVGYKGRTADKRKTGGWKAAPFIIVNEVAERLAFYAIAVNLVTYLVFEMHQSLPDAATHVTDWVGAAFVLTLLGAFLADAYLGRFLTIIIFTCIYQVGLVLLTLSGSIESLRPPKCHKKPCVPASTGQNAFLYAALYLIALGTGGIKPCVSSFGADQFDDSDDKESQKKFSFFNWFYYAINLGALLGITLLVYLQTEKGWTWGFAIPTAATFCSLVILLAGFTKYRYQKPTGSAFTRFFQVMVASLRNHFKGIEVNDQDPLYEVQTPNSDIIGARKLPHTQQFRLLDKAAIVTDAESNANKNRWRLCTVTQVEEFKSFIRVLPVWASTIALSVSFAQISTFFVTQASIMDRKLGPHFEIPAGSVAVFATINALFLVPIYEKYFVPILRAKTGHPRGITSLQRMGIGLFISIFALLSAALVEKKRRKTAGGAGNPEKLSVFWLFPQFFLMGSAEVFTYVGQLEFFYDEATDGTRSISSAVFLSEIGIGSWLSTALVRIVEATTGGVEKGWLRDSLNKSKLDYFYWILAGINGLNFMVYVMVAMRYKGRHGGQSSVGDDSVILAGQTRGNIGNKNNNIGGKEEEGELRSVML
ncbi:OLC1v1018106C1 [Oldenlandia corymbosa var. corymbosa]|uniref:OLC1v1018106C1 n=1 Tax=Oldenlandia corymbosa var. corymbosa TaxID=529605 RepID=A0AAV1EAX1_OLDCO|nr:OLC1v1018106C1 [Oldenlandia corymbosa var. corymbosa]